MLFILWPRGEVLLELTKEICSNPFSTFEWKQPFRIQAYSLGSRGRQGKPGATTVNSTHRLTFSLFSAGFEKTGDNLRSIAATKPPAVKDVLLKKAEEFNKTFATVTNEDKFNELLGQVGTTLDAVEEQLKNGRQSEGIQRESVLEGFLLSTPSDFR